MGTFTYSRNIPNPPDNPSFDVTLMQQNSQSINDLINIEHQGFNTNTLVGGYHKTLTFTAPAPTPTLAASQIQIVPQTFPTGGTTYLENYVSATTAGGAQFNGYLPFVKSIVKFTSSVGPYPKNLSPITGTLLANIFPVTGIQQTGLTTIVITFNTNLPSNLYSVFFDADSPTSGTSAKTVSGFTINFGGSSVATFSFMVI